MCVVIVIIIDDDNDDDEDVCVNISECVGICYLAYIYAKGRHLGIIFLPAKFLPCFLETVFPTEPDTHYFD